jgi:hypothetical protein
MAAAARLIIKRLHITAAVIYMFSVCRIAVAAVGHVTSLLHIMAAVSRHGILLAEIVCKYYKTVEVG